jgi:outer membrane lipase/esterase
VTASLTTIAAPSYSMPAVLFGRDWASGTIGTTVAVGNGITAYAAFTGQAGENNVVNYGGQVGLNVAFNAPPPAISAKY